VINLAALRATGNKPRVHGNGFIQIDMTPRCRLHVWGDPRIPRQKVATQIHDHIFGFKSTIIIGRLVNITYLFEPRDHGDYRVHVPEIREGEDTILNPTSLMGDVEPVSVKVIDWSTTTRWYRMRPFVFHESIAPDGPAATIITKDGPTQAQAEFLHAGASAKPRVLVSAGKVADNDFNRYAAREDMLWRIISDTLKGRTR